MSETATAQPKLTLNLSSWGVLSQREQKLATAVAGAAWKAGYTQGQAATLAATRKVLPEFLEAQLDPANLKRNHKELYKAIMRDGWDLAIKNGAAGGAPIDLKEVTELLKAAKQDVNIELPTPAPVTINNMQHDQEETWSVDRDVESLVEIDEAAQTIRRRR